jgi:membrane protease YdiL (CAAX protease family)
MSETEVVLEGAARLMGTLFLVGCVIAGYLLLRSMAHPPPWRRRIGLLCNRPWQPVDLGIVLCVVAAGQLLAAVAHIPDVDEGTWQYYAQFVLQTSVVFHGAAGAAVWILYSSRNVNPLRAFGMRRGRTAREVAAGVIAYLAAFPAVTIASLLAGLLLSAMNEEQSFQPVVTMMAQPDQSILVRVYLCVLAVVVAPVVEEVVFRGMALPVLTRYLGFPVAVSVVSMVFALMHGHLWSLAPLFAVAVAFSLGYTLTGSLRVPIAMHAVFNAVNLFHVMMFPDTINDISP